MDVAVKQLRKYVLCVLIGLLGLCGVVNVVAWPVIRHVVWQTQQQPARLTLSLPQGIQSKPVVTQHNRQVQIFLPKLTLAAVWQHHMDLNQAGSPALSMQGVSNKQGSTLTIRFRQPVQTNVLQSRDRLTFQFQPGTIGQEPEVSLNLQHVPVRQLLQQLADRAGQDVIIDDAVKGEVSIHLSKATWQQALQLILRSQGLAKQDFHGVWYVAPAQQIAEQDKALQQASAIAPLQLDIIPLHFAKAANIAAMLHQQQANLLGPRGSVMMDERTNTVIVKTTASRLAQLAQVIRTLDKPLPQVKISARIVVVDETALRELGVLLNTTNQPGSALGSISKALVNLPVTSPTGVFGVGLGKISGAMLNLELQALQSQGNGKIIASPELTVADNHQASIAQGDDIPFQTATSSGATQVEFKKAVLGLTVTPQITPDNEILLTLKISKDSVTKQTGTAGNTPVIATSEISTQVMAKNGETVMLGGIKINEQRQDERRVPYVSAIPVIGGLFRNTSTVDKQMDLLVFVTPEVVSPGMV